MMLRMGLLVCDETTLGLREKYGPLRGFYERFVEKAMARLGHQAEWEMFNVFSGASLSEDVEAFSAFFITGSKCSVNDDLPWIHYAIDWIQRHWGRDRSGVPLIGICFGHQLLAKAFGGEVGRNPVGWEIGHVEVDLTEAGRQFFGRSLLRIQETHRDAVLRLPPDFAVVGSSTRCAVQGLVRCEGSLRVLGLQGHPELTDAYVGELAEMRFAAGILSEEVIRQVREGMKRPLDHDEIGMAIAKFILAGHAHE